MSQAGFTPISLYYSTTAAAAPSAVNLTNGELALNITDGKLFYKDNGGSVQVLATAAGASGDVVGPGSSTDNALVRFDGTTGKLVQSSVGVLSDAGVLTGLTGLTSSGSITFSGLTSGRLTYAGTGGLLQDSANLTFDGTTLSVASSNNATSLYFANSSSTIADTTTQLFERTYTPSGSISTIGVGTLNFKAKSTNGVTHTVANIAITATSLSSASTQSIGTIRLNTYATSSDTLAASLRINSGQIGLDADGSGTEFLFTSSTFLPPSTGAYDLGSTTRNWNNFYASGAVTLSGGTANGVAYLNGSKVLTTGSALVFTGTNLGVGTTNPINQFVVSNSGAAGFEIVPTGGVASGPAIYAYNRNTSAWIPLTSFADYHAWNYSGTSEGMRLTSTGLGIGTSSPTQKLTVLVADAAQSTSFQATNGRIRFRPYVDATSGSIIDATNTTESAYSPLSLTGSTIRLTGGGGTGAIIDSAGNLGLGVTPSAWGGGYKGLQVTAGASLGSNGANSLVLGQNWYYNGSNDLYITSNAASAYQQVNGAHKWNTAPSGTAGNAISFTQAMTLDASGNLLIGRTTGTGANLDVYESASNDATIRVGNSQNAVTTAFGKQGSSSYGATSAGEAFLYAEGNLSIMADTDTGVIKFSAGGNTERARIDSVGNLIQTVNTTAATLTTNQTLTFSIVNDSLLRISVRGSDGTTRTATLALA